MKLFNKLLIISAAFTIFGCAATIKRPQVYRAPDIDFTYFINDSAAVYEPLLFRIDNRGLQGELNQQQENIIKKNIQENIRTRLSERLMPRMLEQDHKRALFAEFDPLNNLRKVFARDRGHLQEEFILDDSHIEIIKEFHKESGIRFVIVPAEIILNRNLVEKINERKTIQYNISVYFQIWDIKEGNIILERKDYSRGEETFYDFDSELKFIENIFLGFADQLFYSISMNIEQ